MRVIGDLILDERLCERLKFFKIDCLIEWRLDKPQRYSEVGVTD
jgi:hypothetical protein